jgi:hypothetical protein
MQIDQESVQDLLNKWNDLRIERLGVKASIATLETRVDQIEDQMRSVHIAVEGDLYFIEQPYGLKIGDDYIVVIRDAEQEEFTIQVVDFNLLEEIKNDA